MFLEPLLQLRRLRLSGSARADRNIDRLQFKGERPDALETFDLNVVYGV